uniref:DSN1 component of MIS12 kinetochore complex n=1 Tax=Scleropages formosus TaxID=113540 RepID=A0A8C9SJM4_SCLFO
MHEGGSLRSAKRSPSRSPTLEPPPKSPSTIHSDTSLLLPPGEGLPDGLLGEVRDQGPTLSPRTRRKSWRRSARGRRSLVPLPGSAHALCKTISVTLSEEERLEQLIEESLKLAVQKLGDLLYSTPGADLDLFQKHKESVELEWKCVAKEFRTTLQTRSFPERDPEAEMAMERIRKSISSLQAECACWEALLEKHRAKAEELTRHVEQGRTLGLTLDPARVGQSSQCQFIQSKPDYNSVLHRQRSVLHNMELLMDTHCKIVRELLSFQEECQMAVAKRSRQLASAAGFLDISFSRQEIDPGHHPIFPVSSHTP